MLEGLNVLKSSVPKPLLDFLKKVIVAFWSREDIKSVVELHVEWKMCIVGKRKSSCQFLEPDFLEKFSEEIDKMNAKPRKIAELEEDWFRELLQNVTERFVEINSARVVTSVVYPDQEFPARSNSFWKLEEALFWSWEMMKDADRIGDIKGAKEWHFINISLDNTDIREILGHVIGYLDSFAEIRTKGYFGARERGPLGEASRPAADIERLLFFEIFFFQKR